MLSKSIDAYEKELDNAEDSDPINDTQRELELVEEIRAELVNVHKMLEVPGTWVQKPLRCHSGVDDTI